MADVAKAAVESGTTLPATPYWERVRTALADTWSPVRDVSVSGTPRRVAAGRPRRRGRQAAMTEPHDETPQGPGPDGLGADDPPTSPAGDTDRPDAVLEGRVAKDSVRRRGDDDTSSPTRRPSRKERAAAAKAAKERAARREREKREVREAWERRKVEERASASSAHPQADDPVEAAAPEVPSDDPAGHRRDDAVLEGRVARDSVEGTGGPERESRSERRAAAKAAKEAARAAKAEERAARAEQRAAQRAAAEQAAAEQKAAKQAEKAAEQAERAERRAAEQAEKAAERAAERAEREREAAERAEKAEAEKAEQAEQAVEPSRVAEAEPSVDAEPPASSDVPAAPSSEDRVHELAPEPDPVVPVRPAAERPPWAPVVSVEVPVAADFVDPEPQPETEPDREPVARDDADDVSVAPDDLDEQDEEPPARALRRPRRREPRPDVIHARRSGWWSLSPFVLVLVTLSAWPLGRAVWTSLHRSSVSAPADDRFVGLANYTDVLTSRTWWLAVAVTLALVVLAVGLQLLLASLFAASVRRVTIGRPVLRILLLVPLGVLGVATATVWRDGLTQGFGPDWFGYDGASPGAAMAAVVASEVWRGTGITTLILLAGLERVPSSLRDACLADGATGRQVLTRAVLPITAPAVGVAVVYRSLDALRAFEAPLLARDAAGSDTVPTLLWDSAYTQLESGLAATIAVLAVVLTGLVGLVLTLALRVRRVV
ncbi:MAG: ABC transporter permease subunit [Aeromicrobium erythreum]